MNKPSIAGFFEALETQKVMEFLGQLDIGQMVHNPLLLGGIGALALLSLLMRWRLLLVTILSLSGFVWLVSYIQQQGTKLDGQAPETLLLFVGGGVGLIGLAIYFLFIRTE